jgi:hypothetical protein
MGQVLCCFEEKRQHYYSQSLSKYDDNDEEDTGNVSLRKQEIQEPALRLTGGDHSDRGSTSHNNQDIFAIRKRPH